MIYPRCHFYSFYTKIDLSENFATEPTKGTEKELITLEKALKKIPHTDFYGIQGDENDDTVTNFYTQIRVVEDIER